MTVMAGYWERLSDLWVGERTGGVSVFTGLSQDWDMVRQSQLSQVPLARVGGGHGDGEGRQEGGGVFR